MIDYTTQYAKKVISGEIVAGSHIVATCKRHVKDLERSDLFFDVAAADRVFRFFESVLKLSEGQFEGKPFKLHISQKFILGSVYGWKMAHDHSLRRFHRAYIEQGKGNGKSPLAGGIGLYSMLADDEAGAQVYAAAARKDQANILFQDAVKMVKAVPEIEELLTMIGQNPTHQLTYHGKGSIFKPVSKETGKTGSGLRPSTVLADEIHEHPDRTTMEMLERGFKFRRNPLMFMITNSGFDRNSVCYEEHQHSVKVAHGETVDDRTFSYVCSLDEGDDPLTDPSCWVKANPLLGVTITDTYLQDVVNQARLIPARANGILRLHFCVWTDSDKAWLNRSEWEACEDEDMTLEEFAGQPCWFGLDLSAVKDLTATAQVFADGYTDKGKPKFALFAHAYTPADTLMERVRSDKAPYDVWVKDGFITPVNGKIMDYSPVARDIIDAQQRFDVVAVAYDQWMIRYFELAVEKEFMDTYNDPEGTLPMMHHPQGHNRTKVSTLWMPDSISMFEQLIYEKRIRIQLNPVLRSSISSATFRTSPSGARMFEKAKSSSRIDLAVAAAMAIGAATDGLSDNVAISEWENPDFSILEMNGLS